MSLTRRDFINHVSVGAAAVALARPTTAAEAGSGRKLGVAICGLGNYGRGQVPPALKLTRHCELRGVVTGSPSKGAALAKEHGSSPKNVSRTSRFRSSRTILRSTLSTSPRRTPCMPSM
jgi:glucose-fructose oxidoreductase